MSDLPDHNDKNEPLNTPSGASRAPAAPLPPNGIPGGTVNNMPEGTIDRSDPAHPMHPDHNKHYPGIDPNILPGGEAHPTEPADQPAGAVPQTHTIAGHPENPAGPGHELGAQWDKAAEKEAGAGPDKYSGDVKENQGKAQEHNAGDRQMSSEDAKSSAKEEKDAKAQDQKAGESKDSDEDKWSGNEDPKDFGSPANPLHPKHRAWKAKFKK